MSELLTGPVKATVRLGTKSSKINSYSFAQRQAQQVLTTSICTFSIIFAVVTLIYLVKLKRVFRHTYDLHHLLSLTRLLLTRP